MVYHLAANSDIQKGSQDPTVDYDLTFNTTFNVLQCMKEFKVKKFFFASTSAIYGETSDWLKENYGPLLPVSNYGAAKLASEAFISAFSSMYNIQTWIARFPNVVGERFTHGVIYDFIHKLQKILMYLLFWAMVSKLNLISMSKILLVVFYLSVKILMKKLIFLIWGLQQELR